MKSHYYETTHKDGGVISFDDLDDAIQYADANGCEIISEVGGSWTDYKKCWFCAEWVDVCDLSKNDLCDHCESYLISRGEI